MTDMQMKKDKTQLTTHSFGINNKIWMSRIYKEDSFYRISSNHIIPFT